MHKSVFILVVVLYGLIDARSFAAEGAAIYALELTQHRKTITLAMALEQVFSLNEDVSISRAEIKRLKGARLEIMSDVLPQLQLEGQYGVVNDFSLMNGGLQLKVPLFSLPNIFETKNAFKTVKKSQANNKRLEATIARDVTRAYLNAITALRLVEVAKSQVARWEAQALSLKKRVEVGRTRMLDLRRAEIKVLKGQDELVAQETAYKHALGQLGFVIGEKFVFEIEAPARIRAVETELNLSEMIEHAKRNRSDLEDHKIAEDIAKRRHIASFLRFVPSFDAIGTAKYGLDQSIALTGRFNSTAFLVATVPIFDGVTIGRIDTTRAVVQQEKNRVLRLGRQIELEVHGGLAEIDLKKKSYELAKKTLELANSAQIQAKNLYENGQASGLEVDDAIRDLFVAEIESEKSLLAIDLARVELLNVLEMQML